MAIIISAVEGNRQSLDGGAMFGNAPRAMWSKWLKPDEMNRIQLACRGLLIECDGKRILCETGIGNFFEPKLAERYGVFEHEHRLLISLEKLGLSEEDIDYVILSHLHFDHAGGLLPAWQEGVVADRLHFPRARYVVGKEAFERSVNPHSRDRSSFIPGLSNLLINSERLDVVTAHTLPGVFQERLSFRFSYGHTPGHMHTIFRGDTHPVVFCGDLVPGVPWVHLPITMGYDRFAELVIDEKQQFFEQAIADNWMLFYTHDITHPASYLSRTPEGRYEAQKVRSDLVRLAI